MTRTIGLLLAGCAAVTLSGGCGWLADTIFGQAAKYPDNPFNRQKITTVAILPFFDLTDDDNLQKTNRGYDSLRLAKIFKQEWSHCLGFSLIEPQRVYVEMQKMGLSWTVGDRLGPEKAVKLGRALKADIVVVGAITEFDPYDRPRVGVALQVFYVGGQSGSLDLSRLQQTGRPFPVEAGSLGNQHMIAGFEQVYDSQRRRIFAKVQEYAKLGINAEDRGADETQLVIDDIDRYLRFVSFEVIRNFFHVAPDPLKN